MLIAMTVGLIELEDSSTKVKSILCLAGITGRQDCGTSNMLRVTMIENASEQRWVLQGRLTAGFIGELAANWCASRDREPTRRRVVNLTEVTTIDKDGEQVLLMMIKDGAK